ncbi:4'-phosphopantetheinyl transferase family protein [Aquirhabdus parva]|uniref:Uncharacterized protein n=1 Tax=Aquirhabdus parva TaxID=2283318 RepID=A0A345P3A2_9GAMM|nr:4'-phosphopantetheinyl transferase superfamily protein [Aquirhabdus parva]AXI01761.1 hypothetical protein HYN46_02015 [Aquirhabdus parva]
MPVSDSTVIHIEIRHFSQVNMEEESRLLSLLTTQDQIGVARHADRRQRQLLARVWRREILAQALGIHPEQLTFDQTVNGKPYLNDHAISFNISHSHDAFVLVWCRGHLSVGVDIEDKNRDFPAESLAKRYFHPTEYDAWKNPDSSPPSSHNQWLTTWTRKEAILKAHGMGIRIDLNSFNTQNADELIEHALLGAWQYRSFNLDKQVVSVAWQGLAQLASPNTQ